MEEGKGERLSHATSSLCTVFWIKDWYTVEGNQGVSPAPRRLTRGRGVGVWGGGQINETFSLSPNFSYTAVCPPPGTSCTWATLPTKVQRRFVLYPSWTGLSFILSVVDAWSAVQKPALGPHSLSTPSLILSTFASDRPTGSKENIISKKDHYTVVKLLICHRKVKQSSDIHKYMILIRLCRKKRLSCAGGDTVYIETKG